VVITAASARARIIARLVAFGVGETVAGGVLLAIAVALALLFAFGVARHAMRLARLLAREVIPMLQPERDLGRAPRRALELVLELAAVLLVGFPIAAITQPFVPGGGFVVLAVLAVLAVSASRLLTDLDLHVRAGAELIVEMLARQSHESHVESSPHVLADVGALLPGLDAVPMVLASGSPAIGKSLAELDLRAKSGASVLVILRDGGTVHPSPHEALRAGDVLAVTGSQDALSLASQILLTSPATGTSE
jgi:CPA2 family monovalent cation:H+ antiporter-2